MSFRAQKKVAALGVNEFPKYLIVWGGSDQARVLKPIISALGGRIDAVIDDTPNLPSPFPEIEIFQGMSGLKTWMKGRKPKDIGFAIAIGNPYGKKRCELHDSLEALQCRPVTLVAPSASVDPSAKIGPGCQIMEGALVNVDARLARQCIINTKAIVEHDDRLGEGVEIAPGVTLCGRVHVGNYAWICAGSTIIPRVSIGEAALIGAGSVVIDDIPAYASVAGHPAKMIETKVRNVL